MLNLPGLFNVTPRYVQQPVGMPNQMCQHSVTPPYPIEQPGDVSTLSVASVVPSLRPVSHTHTGWVADNARLPRSLICSPGNTGAAPTEGAEDEVSPGIMGGVPPGRRGCAGQRSRKPRRCRRHLGRLVRQSRRLPSRGEFGGGQASILEATAS